MNGYWDTGTWGDATWDYVPVLLDIDTHDGGKRNKAEEAHRREEAAKAKARRNEVLALFEQIVEGKPKIAEEIAEPFVIEATNVAPAAINYDAMLADLDRVNRIYNEHIEMDDEDVLALI
jgi:hypothetical protein